MESFSLVSFAYAFLRSPLSPTRIGSSPPLTLTHPPTFLAALYVIHYVNRSFISPLRTPSRSKSHVIVVLFGITVHLLNGSLLGTYLSSPAAEKYLAGAFARPMFWAGVGLWALGMVGNVWHDEILLDIRRKAKAKGKGRAMTSKTRSKLSNEDASHHQEYYAIPHGALYKLISYPNYLCEWLEWTGFALAASPLPSLASFAQLLATVSPPWLFLSMEVFTMLPRAWRGHRWYHNSFPDYPRDRKAVIPYVL